MELQLQQVECLARSTNDPGRTAFEAFGQVTLQEGQAGAMLRVSVRLDTAEGLPLVVAEDYVEDELEAGEPVEVQASGYVYASLSGATARLRVDLLEDFEVDLGEHRIPGTGSAIGQAEEVVLMEGVVLRGWSVVVAAPDDQGDARIQLLGVIENLGSQGVAELGIALELLGQPGGEIEAYDEGGLVPGGRVALDASMYIGEAHLKAGLQIRCRATTRRVLAVGISEPVAVEAE